MKCRRLWRVEVWLSRSVFLYVIFGMLTCTVAGVKIVVGGGVL